MTALFQSTCRSHGAFRAAGWRSVSWAEALERFVVVHGLASARIEPLIATGPAGDEASAAVYASAAFVARWREAHGAIDPVTGPVEERRRVRLVEIEAPGRTKIASNEERATEVRIAIDSEVGFLCLHIAATTALDAVGWIGEVEPCLAALAESVTTAVAIARAEECVVLRVLATVGASAVIVDALGRPRPVEARVPAFDPRFVDPLIGRDGRASRRRAHRSRPERGSDGADRFHLLEDGEGRRWVGYSIDLPIGEAAFVAGDRLLVAWPLDGARALTARPSVSVGLEQDLREAFGLSSAEASLAEALVEGDLKQAATRCGIGYETARTHLKSIFRRIGLKSQSELTALLTHFVFHVGLREGLAGRVRERIDPIG